MSQKVNFFPGVGVSILFSFTSTGSSDERHSVDMHSHTNSPLVAYLYSDVCTWSEQALKTHMPWLGLHSLRHRPMAGLESSKYWGLAPCKLVSISYRVDF